MSTLLKKIHQEAENDPALTEDDVNVLLGVCAYFPDSALLFLLASKQQDPSFLRFFIDNVMAKQTAIANQDTVRLREISDEEEALCAQEVAASAA